jgi:hypothetical protein
MPQQTTLAASESTMHKQASISDVVKILDHDRAVECWVLEPAIGADGKPTINKLARICWVYPRDGAGRLRVAVTDWHNGDVLHYVSHAGGFGYDKRTAALAGCTVGGVELGDHCDRVGKPTLRDLAGIKGWMIIGSVG